ncbi:hypothetical protein [Nocardioides endophyticus]|uniref:hypothetical protein n=1 Tax=Nocardioides endophyticus TaxID=1353775 RepID=UPI0031E65630
MTFYRPKTVYVSTPITTGPWFYEELARRGAHGRIEDIESGLLDVVRDHAIAHNAAITAETIVEANSRLPEHNFINPANLVVATWSQAQYISFWLGFIERAAGQVLLSPGWAYSTGCTHEFAKAVTDGLSVVDHTFAPLSLHDGLQHSRQAIAHIKELGLEPTSLMEAVEILSHASGEAT